MNKKNFYKKRIQPKEVEYIPHGDEKALTTRVEELGLHPKTKELFGKNNILTVYDIAKRNSKQLFKIQGFGKKDLIGVERELVKLGLTLAPERDIQDDKSQERDSTKKTEQTERIQPDRNRESRSPAAQSRDNKSARENTEKRFSQKSPQKNGRAVRQDRQSVKTPANEYKRIIKSEKIGLSKGGTEILPAMYDEVFFPKEDMICVDIDGLFGYVNMQNELVIEPKYELAQSFSQGLASVMLNDKYGYIDKTGETVLDFEYDLATPFEEDETARIKKDGRWASITKDGKLTWI